MLAGGGSVSSRARGGVGGSGCCQSCPALYPPQQTLFFSLQSRGLGGKIPTPLQQVGSSVTAMSLHWQRATMAASPPHGSGSPQDRGQVCAGTGSPGWDLQRRGRGLQGRGPFLPPLLLSARGRILRCNFKCYNFLITS